MGDTNKRSFGRIMDKEQDKLFTAAINKEDSLRMNWFQKNERTLQKIIDKDVDSQIFKDLQIQMKKDVHKSFGTPKRHFVGRIHDTREFDFKDINLDIMKPVDPAISDLMYKASHNEGAEEYLKQRVKLLPEDRFYHPETTSFQYGWKMWNAKGCVDVRYGRCEVIKATFYRRRTGITQDPSWYREPAKLSSKVCGCM